MKVFGIVVVFSSLASAGKTLSEKHALEALLGLGRELPANLVAEPGTAPPAAQPSKESDAQLVQVSENIVTETPEEAELDPVNRALKEQDEGQAERTAAVEKQFVELPDIEMDSESQESPVVPHIDLGNYAGMISTANSIDEILYANEAIKKAGPFPKISKLTTIPRIWQEWNFGWMGRGALKLEILAVHKHWKLESPRHYKEYLYIVRGIINSLQGDHSIKNQQKLLTTLEQTRLGLRMTVVQFNTFLHKRQKRLRSALNPSGSNQNVAIGNSDIQRDRKMPAVPPNRSPLWNKLESVDKLWKAAVSSDSSPEESSPAGYILKLVMKHHLQANEPILDIVRFLDNQRSGLEDNTLNGLYWFLYNRRFSQMENVSHIKEHDLKMKRLEAASVKAAEMRRGVAERIVNNAESKEKSDSSKKPTQWKRRKRPPTVVNPFPLAGGNTVRKRKMSDAASPLSAKKSRFSRWGESKAGSKNRPPVMPQRVSDSPVESNGGESRAAGIESADENDGDHQFSDAEE